MTVEDLLQEALQGILDEEAATLWPQLEAQGFTRIGVSEEAGGSGGSADTMYLLLASIGAAAARVPVPETIAAGLLCERAGLVLHDGQATFAPATPRDHVIIDDSGRVNARLERVPWADGVDHLVLTDESRTVIVDRSACTIEPGRNVAGEPRDRVVIDGAAHDCAANDGVGALTIGSAVRSAVMVGALRRCVALAREHVEQRVQFGRPLSSNQILRDRIAALVVETAAAESAARMALETPDRFRVASARVRVGAAADTVTTEAHQLLGAIGFTDEHPLHRYTNRLWAWRDELGSAGWWQAELGSAVASNPGSFWATLTETRDID